MSIKSTQEIIFDMKTVRHLADAGIILTDEKLRDAGLEGAKAGEELRKIVAGCEKLDPMPGETYIHVDSKNICKIIEIKNDVLTCVYPPDSYVFSYPIEQFCRFFKRV